MKTNTRIISGSIGVLICTSLAYVHAASVEVTSINNATGSVLLEESLSTGTTMTQSNQKTVKLTNVEVRNASTLVATYTGNVEGMKDTKTFAGNEIKIYDIIPIKSVQPTENNFKEVILTTQKPLKEGYQYSLLLTYKEEGITFDFAYKTGKIVKENAQKQGTGVDVDYVEIRQNNEIHVFLTQNYIEYMDVDFKIYEEKPIKQISGNGETIEVIVNDTLEPRKSYLLISNTKNIYGGDVTIENRFFPFTTPENLETSNTQTQATTQVNTNNETIEPELSSAGQETAQTGETGNNVEEVAQAAKNTPDTGPKTEKFFIIAILAFAFLIVITRIALRKNKNS